MSTLKKLASQTAIYGLSSIIGRFLNYILTPVFIAAFSTAQYGIISEMYSYVAFLVVLLTYGMETGYFRFYTRDDYHPKTVYYTIIITLLFTTGMYIGLAFLFAQPIADWLHYPLHSEYVTWFAIIVGLDAVAQIPLAKLRAHNKAVKFAFISLSNVFVNIGLNLFFLWYCKPMYESGKTNWIIENLYNPEIGVGYVFISNLVASIIKFVLLIPDMVMPDKKKVVDESKLITTSNRVYSKRILGELLVYSLPLLVAGLAGIVNETIDRIMLKRILIGDLGEEPTMEIVGIYGGVYKLSIIITLFIQAFRYAAEPFFFKEGRNENAPQTYARVMNYFVIVCAVIYLFVMLFLHYLKYFTPKEDYWTALDIVPILLFANIFLGIYYNQSIWYKLTNRTMYGAFIAVFGAALTISINYFFIPAHTYYAAAWATFICYGSMMLISYVAGQAYYPVPYSVLKIFFYLGAAFGLVYFCQYLALEGPVRDFVHSLTLFAFCCMAYFIEFRKTKRPTA
ncbi:MAG TPA: polysaccharide biosynthesis C-terminal domain-containing protein [Flavobacteriales bacterium]|nr:polysaccharide biosynthesis C-terminal domain-containing protein [Flavobacteriales bacterium]